MSNEANENKSADELAAEIINEAEAQVEEAA